MSATQIALYRKDASRKHLHFHVGDEKVLTELVPPPWSLSYREVNGQPFLTLTHDPKGKSGPHIRQLVHGQVTLSKAEVTFLNLREGQSVELQPKHVRAPFNRTNKEKPPTAGPSLDSLRNAILTINTALSAEPSLVLELKDRHLRAYLELGA